MTGRGSALRVISLFPDLLGTYGDSGNATVLERRLAWRGIDCDLVAVSAGMPVPATGDLYVMGGGEDDAQRSALSLLEASPLVDSVERGAQVFAVCAGFQILGTELAGPDGTRYDGLGVLDATTDRLATRAVGEVVTRLEEAELGPVTGFENHAGRTRLGPGTRPLGRVTEGIGNGGEGVRVDGARTDRVIATYLHGPVLARNPALADLVLERALGFPLEPLEHFAHMQLRAERLRGKE